MLVSMATSSALLAAPDHALNYHLVSRGVRRAWLCGWDKVRLKGYWHRKTALEVRLPRLVQCFAVELHAFVIISNHFHPAVRYDPWACSEWSAHEVVQRWVAAVAPLADRNQRWTQQVATLGKRQCPFGNEKQLEHWQGQRNMRVLEVPFALS